MFVLIGRHYTKKRQSKLSQLMIFILGLGKNGHNFSSRLDVILRMRERLVQLQRTTGNWGGDLELGSLPTDEFIRDFGAISGGWHEGRHHSRSVSLFLVIATGGWSKFGLRRFMAVIT